MAAFPLERATDGDLRELCQVLWSWQFCQACCSGKRCPNANCPWWRTKRLTRFFDYYKVMTASYEPDAGPGQVPALKTHTDLFGIIRKLKSEPGLTRAKLSDEIFNNPPGRRQISLVDRNRAINLAVKIMVMVNCSMKPESSGLLELGTQQIRWREDVTFSQFIEDIFPMTDHPGLNDDTAGPLLGLRTVLTAKKLKKHAGLKFRPTDDLTSHLKLDRKSGIVQIYHHTAFLKEHLRMTKEEKGDLTVSDSLKL